MNWRYTENEPFLLSLKWGMGGLNFSFDMSKILAHYNFMKTKKNAPSEYFMNEIKIVLFSLSCTRGVTIIIV